MVDRVAAEAPGTLLLAEAFWLMEGYFVRTLGMHRVYNSAFMHMLRDEDNAGYRRVMKDTLEFDPEILKRYVNFMSNPDEKTAVEQFGKGDKYFGVATVMATLPGLPMLGHGQLEGFSEKYGMEFRRAAWGEVPDEGLVAAHERMLAPILHRRGDYAEVRDFLLYDMLGDDGDVREDVFAYSNGRGPSRSLVVYHNKYADTSGWIRASTAFAVKDADGSKHLEQRTLADGLGLSEDAGLWLRFRDARAGLEYLRAVGDVRDRGLHLALHAYETIVFGEFRELADPAGVWRRLADRLGERGVPSLDEALLEETLAPVHAAIRALAADPALDGLVRSGRPPSADELMDPVRHLVATIRTATGTSGDVDAVVEVVATRLVRIGSHAPASVHGGAASDDVDGHEPPDGAALPARATGDPILAVTSAFADPWHRAVLVAWSILEPLGRLAPDAMVGPTSRAWFDELRLGTVLATSLRDRGLDEAQAWAASDRIRMLMTLARPSNVTGRSAADRARAVTDAWLLDGASQRVLGVNTYEGVRWFAREGWRELIDWALLLDLVAAPEDAKTSAAVAAKQLAAGDASGYRVDDLLTALGGTPTGARGGAASGRGAKPAPTPAAGPRTDGTSPDRRRPRKG